jgi:cytochrome c oxidase assembly protein subunit 15
MNVIFKRLAQVGTVFALIVVVVGAMVRLADAGLGCPDWPGCYGSLIVPDQILEQAVNVAYPERPLDEGKAWWEMFHRYIAATLGLICVALAVIAWRNRADPQQPLLIPSLLLGVVVFQGLLGMWTVTLLLKPVIVMAHLLGGLTTLGLLFLLARRGLPRMVLSQGIRRLALAGLVALVLQIALGGWTSANYAALACPDLPTCQTQWWPSNMDYQEGFILWRGIGIDYEGGVLDNPARVAIHFTHRLGAIVATLLLGLLAWQLVRVRAGLSGWWIGAALALQVSLGLAIVWFGVPFAVAAAHNGVAALLLLSVINANQRIRTG